MAAKKFLRLVNGVLTEIFGVQASAGAGNAGDIVSLDDSGRIDNSMMPVGIGADTAAIPASETLAPLYRAQAMLALFLLVVLAAGTLVIHYAMKVNYRPIQELTESLGRSDADDLESLKDAIASLAEQNNHMRSQLMTSPDGQTLKDSLLFSLLKGKFDSFASYNIEAEALGMSFTKPCYQVLMLRAFNQDTAIPRQTLSATVLPDDNDPDKRCARFEHPFETVPPVSPMTFTAALARVAPLTQTPSAASP